MIGTLSDTATGMLASPLGSATLDVTHALAPAGWMLIALLAASAAAIAIGSAERLGTALAATWAEPFVALARDVGSLVVSCGWAIAGFPVRMLLTVAVAAAPTPPPDATHTRGAESSRS